MSGTFAEEWKLRVDLAAAYQICQKLNLNEGICNHLTVSLPGDAATFLVVPYGLLYGGSFQWSRSLQTGTPMMT